MSVPVVRIGIAGALGLHAIAHTIALAALLRQALGPAPDVAARSWLFPDATPSIAAAVAIPFWLVAAVAFVLAAVSFWGVRVPFDGWRRFAVVGAVASITGVAIFLGTWPGSPDAFYSLLNDGVALAMNAVVLGSQLWLHWPSPAVFGR
jgi:hypothetical protein